MQNWQQKNEVFLQFLQNWYIFGKFMFVNLNKKQPVGGIKLSHI